VRNALTLSAHINEDDSHDEATNRERGNQDRPDYLAASALVSPCLLDQLGTHDQ
jgi:hypothetical protein